MSVGTLVKGDGQYLNVELHDWASVADSHGSSHQNDLCPRYDLRIETD